MFHGVASAAPLGCSPRVGKIEHIERAPRDTNRLSFNLKSERHASCSRPKTLLGHFYVAIGRVSANLSLLFALFSGSVVGNRAGNVEESRRWPLNRLYAAEARENSFLEGIISSPSFHFPVSFLHLILFRQNDSNIIYRPGQTKSSWTGLRR